MKTLYYILFPVLLLCAGYTNAGAQVRVVEDMSVDTTAKNPWDNNITFNADPRLAILLDRHKTLGGGNGNGGVRYMRGYRVQIYYGIDRSVAIQRKVDFIRRFPYIKTYMSYTQPQYRVKVGNFATREDAVETYREAIRLYGACMIVPDNVIIVNTPQGNNND